MDTLIFPPKCPKCNSYRVTIILKEFSSYKECDICYYIFHYKENRIKLEVN